MRSAAADGVVAAVVGVTVIDAAAVTAASGRKDRSNERGGQYAPLHSIVASQPDE